MLCTMNFLVTFLVLLGIVVAEEYYYSEIPSTFSEAQQNCALMGGYLAELYDDKVETKIRQDLDHKYNGAKRAYWVGGLNYLTAKKDSWHWFTSGKDFSCTNWCPGEPNNAYKGGEHCVFVFYSKDKFCWYDQQCNADYCKGCGTPNDKLFYICALPHLYFSDEPSTFNQAQQSCEKYGGQLVEIKNHFKALAVKEELDTRFKDKNRAYWIGGLNYLTASKYLWHWAASGENFTYTNWCPGEPNNAYKDGENCLFLIYTKNKYCWIDQQCYADYCKGCGTPNDKLFYICEFPRHT